MAGKNKNNHYCYDCLILETYIKISKMRIMRWGTDYTTKSLHNLWIPNCYWRESQSGYFCSVSAMKHQMEENREKAVFIISRRKRKLPHWFIVQNYRYWFKKIIPL